MEAVSQKAVVEWQTRTLASFLSVLPMSSDAASLMAKAVEHISIFNSKGNPLVAASQVETGPSKQSESEPRTGSYEKLSTLFGSRRARPK